MSKLPPALPDVYAATPGTAGPAPTPELEALVLAQVEALVAAAPATTDLENQKRVELTKNIARVATYAAALALDDWQLSEKLGQRPLVKTRETLVPGSESIASTEDQPEKSSGASQRQTFAMPLARADFQAQSASQIGAVTRSTLRAISFPSFVADLIKGTFNAILDATQTQMGAFTEMLDAVSKTVSDFENDNISDAQANQWLVQSYPAHIRLETSTEGSRAVPTDEESAPPGLRSALNLPDEIDSIDEVTIEEILVPAARRKLAQSRLQMLSTMVMMGLQRIVINHGRIRATMGFHIDATDSARAESADLLDTSVSAQAQVGFGWWSASAATSVTYVRSTKADSSAELNVEADLTGEVDLTFSTDYLPLNRMATTEKIERIRANTPNPAENAPGQHEAAPAQQTNSAADMVASRFNNRQRLAAPTLPGINQQGAESGSGQEDASGASEGREAREADGGSSAASNSDQGSGQSTGDNAASGAAAPGAGAGESSPDSSAASDQAEAAA